MKKYIFAIFSVCAALLFAGCSENLEFEDVLPVEKHYGEEVKFGGSASYNVKGGTKNGTRTVYGGYENITDGKEPVYWTQGDAVRVYCPEASNKTADYNVDVTGNNTITTSLSRRGESALQWGNPNNQHTFYAMYPAPSATETGKDLNGVSTITGTIPATQTPIKYEKLNGYDHVFAPDMNYAYMVAKTVIPVPNNVGENVYLKFMPIATALEITLRNASGRTLNLNSVVLSSKNNGVAGSFTANLETMALNTEGSVKYGKGYPETAITGNTTNSITVPFVQNAGEGSNSLEVKLGESVTFTVFMLPTADITDLQIRINGIEDGNDVYKTGTFNGVTVEQKKKTYLRNLSISATPYTDAAWFKAVYENASNTKMLSLSIPAAGGAGSGYTTAGDYYVEDNLRQQNYDIPTLWNLGIRCFEFAVDIASGEEDGLLGQQPLLSGGTTCGITLGDAVTHVVNQLVANPHEFAMVILTYQNTNGWGGMSNITRNPAMFMKQANVFWGKMQAGLLARNEGKEELKHINTALYSPTMTAADAHGKLFCICRPTSIYQDYGSVLKQSTGSGSANNNSVQNIALPTMESPHEHMMVIQGWGALKDKWQQRGYSNYSVRKTNTNGNDGKPGRPFDVSTMNVKRTWHSQATWDDWLAGYYTYSLDGNVPVESNYTITTSKLTPDFSYDISTNIGNTTKGAWVQEWARVSNLTEVYWHGFANGVNKDNFVSETGWDTECKTAYWAPSFDEKITRINETLEKAIGRQATDTTVYINSLCGYYIDPDIESSYLPLVLTDRNIGNNNAVLSVTSATAGMAGNIQAYAHDVNKQFNTKLQSLTANKNIGPMGIIMMDRVGEVLEDGDESSKVIPQIIIANNFTFTWNDATSVEVPGSSYNPGDVLPARKHRTASKDVAEPTIVWE